MKHSHGNVEQISIPTSTEHKERNMTNKPKCPFYGKVVFEGPCCRTKKEANTKARAAWTFMAEGVQYAKS